MTKQLEVKADGDIVKVRLNRPEVLNALDMDLVETFADLISELAVDDGVRGIVISGKGKAFCVGGDLKWIARYPKGAPAAFHRVAGRGHQAVVEIRKMAKPVIAAINGIAAGGGFSLALACDFRIMAKSAILRQAFSSNGLCIDGGGTFTLPRMVGLARALEIAAFDRPISSKEALALGLVTKVVEDGRALEEAVKMAHELARCSLNSFGWSKRLLTGSFNATLEAQVERERTGLCSCASHADGIEGMRAFLEKRKPVFGAK
jgi:2-(1,2-epoxy-1,2-dihydrophenyl)acetyl-CoA isomerase